MRKGLRLHDPVQIDPRLYETERRPTPPSLTTRSNRCSILNMSSVKPAPHTAPKTAARIRDAAIVEFAAHGFTKSTVRAIAESAGVSPGLVIHHFGSKDG